MQIAETISGERISSDHAEKGVIYHCPVCNQDVFLRHGDINIAHFAHKHACTDNWNYDMSIWHSNWQMRYPIEMREVVKEFNGQKHRADILIEDKKVVIEFQHSSISKTEIIERTDFYNSLGYKVIWVFDVCECHYNLNLELWLKDYYIWNHPKRRLKNLGDMDMVLFLQLEKRSEDNDDYLEKQRKFNQGLSAYLSEEYYNQDKGYLGAHKDDESLLIRVKDWKDPSFPGSFYSNGKFDEVSFVDFSMNYIDNNHNELQHQKLIPEESTNTKYIKQQNEGKTVFDFWDEDYNIKYMILKNRYNDYYFKFIENPKLQYEKKNTCFAYISKDPYSFPHGLREIFYTSEKVWTLKYMKILDPKS